MPRIPLEKVYMTGVHPASAVAPLVLLPAAHRQLSLILVAELATRGWVFQALPDITGAGLGTNPPAWRDWWPHNSRH